MIRRLIKTFAGSTNQNGDNTAILKSISCIDHPHGGKEIIEAINGKGLIAASDGSIKGKKDGSYVYSIQAINSNNNRLLVMQRVPKSNEMSSLTAESYGMLGMLCTQHKDHIAPTGKM